MALHGAGAAVKPNCTPNPLGGLPKGECASSLLLEELLLDGFFHSDLLFVALYTVMLIRNIMRES